MTGPREDEPEEEPRQDVARTPSAAQLLAINEALRVNDVASVEALMREAHGEGNLQILQPGVAMWTGPIIRVATE